MRLEINKIRQLIRLVYSDEPGYRQIGRILGTSHQTVARYAEKAKLLEINQEKLEQLDDVQLELLLRNERQTFFKDTGIDWSFIDREHHFRGVPLIVLWTEYCESMRSSSKSFLGEASFRRRYRSWRKSQRISMRQFHAPGDKIFVDFAGKTVPIFSETTDEIKTAQIFVASLGGSGLIFAHAVESQKIADWLTCHVEMFSFFGGVSNFIVPDNLRSAVDRHNASEVLINRSYQELADHYRTIIVPARARKPKDKSLAEVSVRIVQSWALNSLRNIKFFSVTELNDKLKKQIEIVNSRITKTYPESRLTKFFEIEKEFLKPLPYYPYAVATWKYGLRVPEDYYIKHEDSFYSVPYQYRLRKVDLRITSTTLEVFNGAKRIASHTLIKNGHRTELSHMPEAHRITHENSSEQLIEWANSIGSSTEQWCRHHLQSKSTFANGKKAVENLRKLARVMQNSQRLESAIAFAIKLNSFSISYLREVINRNLDLKPVPEKTFFVTEHENIRGKESFRSIGNK